MAAGYSVACSARALRFCQNPSFYLDSKPTKSLISPSIFRTQRVFNPLKRKLTLTVCFVLEKERREIITTTSSSSPGRIDDEEEEEQVVDMTRVVKAFEEEEEEEEERKVQISVRVAEKLARKKSERHTYLVAAVMSTLGITWMAIAAVYYRFSWQMEGGEIPISEMFGTFALSVGAAVGMEFWARWAHKALWHASLWNMHESHHKPREGPFELNDIFAIINAVPAIALLNYGFFHKGLIPGLCFGAGLGITVFGMAYMFVHDGLVHRRFPVGPIANVPYFRRVAAAHQLHHYDKFEGVPYGLFLGPMELEEVGGLEELDKEVDKRIKLALRSSSR